jgi:hypothetical protein
MKSVFVCCRVTFSLESHPNRSPSTYCLTCLSHDLGVLLGAFAVFETASHQSAPRIREGFQSRSVSHKRLSILCPILCPTKMHFLEKFFGSWICEYTMFSVPTCPLGFPECHSGSSLGIRMKSYPHRSAIASHGFAELQYGTIVALRIQISKRQLAVLARPNLA